MRFRTGAWVLTGLAWLAVAGCASLGDLVSPPTVRVASLTPVRLTPDSVEFLARLAVNNPNPISLPVERIGFRVAVNAHPLLDGALEAPGRLEAMSEREIELPFRIKYREFAEAAASLRNARELTLAVDGRLAVASRWGFPELRFAVSRVLPVPRLPGIALGGLKIIENRQLGLEIRLRNENTFSCEIKACTGALTVGGASYALAGLDRPRTVPAGQEGVLTLRLGDSLEKTAALAAAVLLGKRFDLGVTAELTGATPYGELSLPYDSRGNGRP